MAVNIELNESSSTSAALAQAVSVLQPRDVPVQVMVAASSLLKDWIGVALAGSQTPQVKKLVALSRDFNPGGPCHILGWDVRTGPQEAALVNGAAGQALDFDNTSEANNAFISSPVLPALFALAKFQKVSAATFLTAYVAGVEVATKLGIALTPEHYDRGWHTTFTTGSIGAAAASSRLLGLDPEATNFAISIAATQTSGLRVHFGTEVKAMHAGLGARAGLLGAMAARRGIVASRTALEGRNGYLQMFSGEAATKAKLSFGVPWSLMDPGPEFRIYPCCQCIHRPIDALLGIIREHGIRAEDVESMRCGVSFWTPGVVSYDRPQNGPQAKFSIPYVLARVLASGEGPLLSDFTDNRVRDPSILPLVERISIYVHPEIASRSSDFKEFAELNVQLKSGRELSKRVYSPRGTKEAPISNADVDRKFLSVMGDLLEQSEVQDLAGALDDFSGLADVTAFLDVLPVLSCHRE
jgi:2-methylcitrate dehydratase PrpD|tara:strand:+ start:2250 stop:3656 length:1407 start_codon:yes stop_codon:yes gene_type:complete